MIDVEVSRELMEVNVYVSNKLLPAKKEKLDKDTFKEYMVELSGDNLEVLRYATKLFKPTKYLFKDVK